MEKEKIEALLIDYIDGNLTEGEKQAVEKQFSENEEVYTLYQQLKEVIHTMDHSVSLEPLPKLQTNFSHLLMEEISKKEGRTRLFHPVFLRVAASVVLLVVGGGIGFWINAYHQQQVVLESMRKEIEITKRAMITMLDNRQSASQRLQGANVAYKMENADGEIVAALVKTMNEDPNTNVRLAALDALRKFHQQLTVRKALIASLSKQNDPVVQIALIRLMVEMKEKEVVDELERITTDEEVLPAVKDEAHAGILRLS